MGLINAAGFVDNTKRYRGALSLKRDMLLINWKENLQEERHFSQKPRESDRRKGGEKVDVRRTGQENTERCWIPVYYEQSKTA